MEGDCKNIAIIGAGASGTITAIQLLRKLNVKTRVYLIEKNEASLYRGAAYSSKLVYEPLNVPAGRMSIFNHLPDDFYNWIKQNKQDEGAAEVTRDSFVSRRWFGDYLTERIGQAKEQARFASLEVVTATVNEIEYCNKADAYELQLSGNRAIHADYLIFATGNETPADPINISDVGQLNGAYVGNPWT